MKLLKHVQFWALLLICTWLSLAPQLPGVFEAASDKVWHFLAYFVLYLSLDFAIHNRTQHLSRFMLLLSYSFLIETIQHFVPNREFSLLDLAANAAGLVCGLLASYLWRQASVR